MRNYDNVNIFKKIGIKPHQIILSNTTIEDYEAHRELLLDDIDDINFDEYLLLEGGHCSCYDFDETEWCGTVYTREELLTLANAKYNTNNIFWKQVKIYLEDE